MKSIVQHINESRFQRPGKTVLHFYDASAALMFDLEMKGQISDGKYENSSPSSHWLWVTNCEFVVDGNEYYTGYEHRKRYNLNEWVKSVKEILKGIPVSLRGYEFTIRLYDYGRLGRVVHNIKDCQDGRGSIRYEVGQIAELFGRVIRQNPDATWADVEHTVEGRNYYAELTRDRLYNEETFEAFKNVKYKFSDFKEDVKSMENSINTYDAR